MTQPSVRSIDQTRAAAQSFELGSAPVACADQCLAPPQHFGTMAPSPQQRLMMNNRAHHLTGPLTKAILRGETNVGSPSATNACDIF
jgi:hypothetical protein